MKLSKVYPAILLVFVGYALSAQRIDLTTQAEVDAWDQSITVLSERVFISGDDITNIDAFSNITEVSGILDIRRSDNLLDINGLSSLELISGTVEIINNNALTNVDGLSSLTTLSSDLIGGRGLTIQSNNLLVNIDGLSNLSVVDESLSVNFNDILPNVDGLLGISEVNGRIDINGNKKLISIEGLTNINELDGLIRITDNNILAECCILSFLTEEFPDNVIIEDNYLGCQSVQDIVDFCGIRLTLGSIPPCIGANNGSITILVSNYDTIPFNYTWELEGNGIMGSDSSNDDIFTIPNLEAGIYHVSVTLPNGDEESIDSILLDPVNGSVFEIIEITGTNSSNGFPNGNLHVEFDGGTAPYNLEWFGASSGALNNLPDTEATIDNLGPGEYNLIITDSDQLSKHSSVTLLDEIVPNFPCTEPLDIVILNDVSGSVDAVEYEESKAFFVDFLRSANIGTNQTQAAIFEWSCIDCQSLMIPLTGKLSELEAYTSSTRAFSEGTYPHPAMQLGADYIESNGRDGVDKVIVLSTDGRPSESLVSLADELKARGFHIVTIAFDGAFSHRATRDLLSRTASIDLLAPGAPAYSQLNKDLADNIINLYVCPLDPGSSATVYFNRDGAVIIDSILTVCPVDGLVEVAFTVSASRELSIPPGTQLTFYHNDPRLFGATAITSYTIPCAIAIGESETYRTNIPLRSATNLYLLLNDDGMQNPPLEFPLTELEEIAYTNNVANASICVGVEPSLQVLKYTSTPGPLCDSLIIYTIDVCNISALDARDVVVDDIPPSGAFLNAINVNANGCSLDSNGSFDIPAGCCVSLTYYYDATDITPGLYNDQDVLISGPSGQNYNDYDGRQSSAEDILIEFRDCGISNIFLEKEVNVSEICEDGSLEYVYFVYNESDFVIQGARFTDVVPAPAEWVFRPYAMDQISISRVDISGSTASFIIDEIPAQSVASFRMDVYTGDWEMDGIISNRAILDDVINPQTGALQTLESNVVSTDIIANVEIMDFDTLIIMANQLSIDLEAISNATTGSTKWTSGGDGLFEDSLSISTIYHFGEEDRRDTLIPLFFAAKSFCEEIGKPLFVRRVCSLSFDSLQNVAICEDATFSTTLTWKDGIGPYSVNGDVDLLEIDSLIISDLNAGLHTYTLEDGMGCRTEIDFMLEETTSPFLIVTGEDEQCNNSNGQLSLEISSGASPYDISGSFTMDNVFGDVFIDSLMAGEYSFIITDANGCTTQDMISLENIGMELELSQFENEYTVNKGDNLDISISTNILDNNIQSVNWIPSIDCENCLDVTLVDLQEDTHFSVTVIDINGCEATLDFSVFVSNDLSIYIPTVINPGREIDGIFLPFSADDNLEIIEMNIYDRWGNLVFTNQNFLPNDLNEGWNGTAKGEAVNVGVYAYMMTIDTEEGIEVLAGSVTVLK